MNPLSIIIPVWNRERQIIDTLRSIASQEGIDRCCLIIVDNASTDSSRRLVADWIADNPAIDASLANCAVRGAAAARNAGIALVHTPWLMQFDSDDLMRPGLIAAVLSVIDSECDNDNNKESGSGDHFPYDLITWDVEIRTLEGQTKTACGLRQGEDMLWQNIVHGALATQRYAVRTQLMRDSGGWDETCMGWNDMESGTRILRHNVTVKHLDAIFVNVIHCDNSITERKFSTNPGKWEHALDLMSESMADCPEALRWIDYRRVILAAFYRRENNSKEARRLLHKTLQEKPFFTRLLLRTIYFKHCLITRGSYLLASLFYSRKFSVSHSDNAR